MNGKATAFAEEIKRLYEKINSIANKYVASVDALITTYGLTLPLTQAQIDALTPKRRGEIMAAISPALAEVGKEVESVTWKTNLLAIGPYATMDALKADIANLVPANSTTIATTDIDRLIALTALADGLLDGVFVFSALNKILQAKDGLNQATINFSKV